jgi:flagellar export protein FliJ
MAKSTLEILARIKKNDLNLLRQEVAQLEQQITRLDELLDTLEKGRSQEFEFSRFSPEYAFVLEAYLKVNKQQTTQVGVDIKKLQEFVTQLREQLFKVFSEEKRYEVLEERHAKDKRAHLEQQEGQELDEIGLEQWKKR